MAFLPKRMEEAGPWTSLAVLVSGSFITILDVFIVNVALPDIQRELHASDAELQLIMVSYNVAYGAMLLNGARLGDLFGRRRLFLLGMALFLLASLLCALAGSPWMLIGSRVLQGVGAALLMPQVYTSLRLLFEGDDRSRAFAIMGGVQGIAGASSQVIGGYLIGLNVADLGWRLVFLVNIPVALYALVTGRWMIRETRAPVATNIDILGAFIGTLALALLLFPLMIGREQNWPWWAIVGPLMSVPLFVCFTVYEKHLAKSGGVPIVEISLFKEEGFSFGILASLLFFSAISSFSLSLTILLQIGLGHTALEAGTIFVPSAVAFFVGSIFSAFLEKRIGQWAPILGLLIFAIGLLIALFVGAWGNQNIGGLTVSLVLNGLGQGIVIPLLLNTILSTISHEKAGMASGTFSTADIVGSALGVTFVGMILFSILERGQENKEVLTSQLYGYAFSIATLYNFFVIVGSMVLLVVINSSKKFHLNKIN